MRGLSRTLIHINDILLPLLSFAGTSKRSVKAATIKLGAYIMKYITNILSSKKKVSYCSVVWGSRVVISGYFCVGWNSVVHRKLLIWLRLSSGLFKIALEWIVPGSRLDQLIISARPAHHCFHWGISPHTVLDHLFNMDFLDHFSKCMCAFNIWPACCPQTILAQCNAWPFHNFVHL